MRYFYSVFLLILIGNFCSAQKTEKSKNPENEKKTEIAHKCNSTAKPCKDGIILPTWRPLIPSSTGAKAFRAFIYLAALLYMFVGVSIVSDCFMSAIEVITSQERELKIKRGPGQTSTIIVRVWNETVSNLTLMALGSSAPEILLSVIEVCGNRFEAGDLGPGTIVGSAAYNLYIIVAICIMVIPSTDVRRIKHIDVFW